MPVLVLDLAFVQAFVPYHKAREREKKGGAQPKALVQGARWEAQRWEAQQWEAPRWEEQREARWEHHMDDYESSPPPFYVIP